MAIRNNLDEIVNVDIEIATPGSSDESYWKLLIHKSESEQFFVALCPLDCFFQIWHIKKCFGKTYPIPSYHKFYGRKSAWK